MLQKITGLITFFALSLLISLSALAADTPPDARRASLVAYWEEKIKTDPQVQKFEKTDAEGIYNFSTTFFPYTGRLKLLNAAITDKMSEYSDVATGLIEVELMDAKPDFFTKYTKSYSAWNSSLYYYYDPAQKVWFLPAEWSAHATANNDAVTSAPAKQCFSPSLKTLIRWVLSLAAIAILLIVLISVAKKQNKRVWSRNDEIFENQKISIKNTERMLSLMEEQTKLLQKITENLEKK